MLRWGDACLPAPLLARMLCCCAACHGPRQVVSSIWTSAPGTQGSQHAPPLKRLELDLACMPWSILATCAGVVLCLCCCGQIQHGDAVSVDRQRPPMVPVSTPPQSRRRPTATTTPSATADSPDSFSSYLMTPVPTIEHPSRRGKSTAFERLRRKTGDTGMGMPTGQEPSYARNGGPDAPPEPSRLRFSHASDPAVEQRPSRSRSPSRYSAVSRVSKRSHGSEGSRHSRDSATLGNRALDAQRARVQQLTKQVMCSVSLSLSLSLSLTPSRLLLRWYGYGCGCGWSDALHAPPLCVSPPFAAGRASSTTSKTRQSWGRALRVAAPQASDVPEHAHRICICSWAHPIPEPLSPWRITTPPPPQSNETPPTTRRRVPTTHTPWWLGASRRRASSPPPRRHGGRVFVPASRTQLRQRAPRRSFASTG